MLSCCPWFPPPAQVMEILAHVNKRIKGQPSIRLPLAELVALAAQPRPSDPAGAPNANPMVRTHVRHATLRTLARKRPQPRPRCLVPCGVCTHQHTHITCDPATPT